MLRGPLDPSRKRLFVFCGLVLMSFTLVLILLLNVEVSQDEISPRRRERRTEVEVPRQIPKTQPIPINNIGPTKINSNEQKSPQVVKNGTIPKAIVIEKDNGDIKEDIKKENQIKTEERRKAVVRAFQHAWTGYKQNCWGQDEVRPSSKQCQNWLQMGLTIVDSLDTLWIMGLKTEFDEATKWVEEHFDPLQSKDSHCFFEVNIRVVGGLLSAYDLTKNRMFLEKANSVVDRYLPAFEKNPSGIPFSNINLRTGESSTHSWTGGAILLVELGTLQMEWMYLSHHLGDPKYAHKVLKLWKTLNENTVAPYKGLYGTHINAKDGTAAQSTVTLGAPADSFYEYILKVWFLTNKKVDWIGEMWDITSSEVIEHMVTTVGNLTFPAALHGQTKVHTVDQLACFAGGLFALSAQHTPNKTKAQANFKFGAGFTEFCHKMYHDNPSGLPYEIVTVTSEGNLISGINQPYQLRPETIESLFYMYRLTGEEKYRDWSWEIFEAIETHAKVPTGGYSNIDGVGSSKTIHQTDFQPSWFLAESLKYFYLTFSPNVIPLDRYVLNTEAHPLSIFTPDPSLYKI